jgi:hypothetical protein
MATLGALVDIVAAAEGISRERVEAIARAVREAGLIATHGRGSSAAQMTETDAANLLIAVNAAETARAAPETVRRFRALRADNKSQHEFGRVLEEMIAATVSGEIVACLLDLGFRRLGVEGEKRRHALRRFDLRIEFQSSPPLAVIECRLPATRMPQFLPFYPPREKSAGRAEVDRRTTITDRTILAIAERMRA